MVIEETDVGISWIVRLCALFTTLGALFLYTNKRVLSCLLMTMSGGVALATLAREGTPLCMTVCITISIY